MSCRNDCIQELLFPKPIFNRPGLPTIGYRIGVYADFREALIRNLDKSVLLSALTHREADDPAIALLECAAIVGDVLTFYQEFYANEAYLRTATWSESISDLVRIIGYRLTPAVGGRGVFAFEVKGDLPVTIPAGFGLKADVEGLEEQADFETETEAVAYPALSRFSLYRPFESIAIDTGGSVFAIATAELEAAALTIQPNDRLMLVDPAGGTNPARQVVIVKSIEKRLEMTEITIEGVWQGGLVGTEISAYKLGRSFRHFGYNAPPFKTVVTDGEADQVSVGFSRLLSGSKYGLNDFTSGGGYGYEFRSRDISDEFAIGGGGRGFSEVSISDPYNPLPSGRYFPLDSEVDDISGGSPLLLSLELSSNSSGLGSISFFERTIVLVNAATLTQGSLTGGTTVVQLDSGVTLSGASTIYTDIRTVEMQEVIGKKITLTAARTAVLSAGGTILHFYGSGEDYQSLNQRQVQLSREGQVETVTMTIDGSKVEPADLMTLRPLALSPQLQLFTIADFPLRDPSVVAYGNLVTATQGKTEKPAILGNGDARQIFQTFKLPKAPLTYLTSSSADPPEVPQLQITVDGIEWTRVSTFFNSAPTDRVYLVREDSNSDSWVQFGDGKTGAQLPSGVKNVAAVFRTGTGAFGAQKAGTKVQPAKLKNLDKVQLPDGASGGAASEDPLKAKEAAPAKIQSLGRLVSLRDFEAEALAISGVSKVLAAWKLHDNIPALVITVLMDAGREAELDEAAATLTSYNICRGPQRFPVIVEPGTRQQVFVNTAYSLVPGYQEEIVSEAIHAALGTGESVTGLFSIRSRAFGEREYATRIEGIIQQVEGVAWVDVTTLGHLGSAPNPAATVISCAANHILTLNAADLQLSPATVLVGVCNG